MDRENLSQFLDNTIRACREQAQSKNLSEEESQKMLNETLMQFYRILAGYTNGVIDSKTHQLFIQKSPKFGTYLEDLEQQEKARIDGLKREREELQRRLAQIDTELGTSKTVKRSETRTTSTRESQEDPCSRGGSRGGRGGGRC